MSLQDTIAIEKAMKNVLDGNANKSISSNFEMKNVANSILLGNRALVNEIKKLSTVLTKKPTFKQKDPNSKIINELEMMNSLTKENSKLLRNIGKAGGILGDIAKVGLIGGALGYLLFGDKKHLLNMVGGMYEAIKPLGGVISGFLTGDYEKVKGSLGKIEEGINSVLGDGVVGQILTGKYKPFNTVVGAMKVQGGLFQGLIFGDWKLFWSGFDDLKKNLSMGQMGILGALLFGMPLAKGALSALSGTIMSAALANPLQAATVASVATIITSIGFGVKAYLDRKDSNEFKKEFLKANENKLVNEMELRNAPKEATEEALKLRKEIAKINEIISSKRGIPKNHLEYLNAQMDEKQNRFGEILKLYPKPTLESINNQPQPIMSTSGVINTNAIPNRLNEDVMVSKVNKYASNINAVSKKYGIDPLWVAAIMMQESAGNPSAKSWTGVRGLMQVTGDTAKSMGYMGSDYWNPENSIELGGKYMANLKNQFGGITPEMITAYNAGPTNVKKLMSGQQLNATPERLEEIQKYYPFVKGKYDTLSELQKAGKLKLDVGQLKFDGELDRKNNLPSSRVEKDSKKDNNELTLKQEDKEDLAKMIGYEFSKVLPKPQQGYSSPLVNPRRP